MRENITPVHSGRDDNTPAKPADRSVWEVVRRHGKRARVSFTDCLKARGVTSGAEYGACTNSIYLGLFGQSAQQLKRELGVKRRGSTRDYMDVAELSYLMASESLSAERITDVNAHGFKECQREAYTAARNIRRAIDADRAGRQAASSAANQNEADANDAA